jgi:hypothetical protein
LLVGSALALVGVAPADAAVYLFTYTGDATASWTLPSSPVPVDFDVDYFETDDILVTFNGITGLDYLIFYTADLFGGFGIDGLGVEMDSMELFTGTTEFPTFKLGTFATTPFFLGTVGNGSLTISVAPSLVPEPASWAMLIAGFSLTGAAMRRTGRLKPCPARKNA